MKVNKSVAKYILVGYIEGLARAPLTSLNCKIGNAGSNGTKKAQIDRGKAADADNNGTKETQVEKGKAAEANVVQATVLTPEKEKATADTRSIIEGAERAAAVSTQKGKGR